MALVLRWRVPPPVLSTRWRGPAGVAEAVRRDPATPIAAIIGPPGADGPPGPSSVPIRVDFTGAATWTSPHALGRVPEVAVYLDSGERALADVVATPINFTVTHAAASSGFVLLI